jgi:hypothetical protein
MDSVHPFLLCFTILDLRIMYSLLHNMCLYHVCSPCSLGWKMVATAMLMNIICQQYSMSVHNDLSVAGINLSSV